MIIKSIDSIYERMDLFNKKGSHRRHIKMKKRYLALIVLFALWLTPSLIQAEDSLNGFMFADYYNVINHHVEDYEGQHGFWFRRIYFTYNSDLTDKIKMRLRFEMASSDFTKDSDNLYAFVKDAYLSFKVGSSNLLAGIISTPTWGNNVENMWGYRALEKTPMDLFKLGSSRDFGIGFKGNFDKDKKFSYNFLIGNGASNKSETNQGKKLYGAIAFKPVKGLVFELYGDYEVKSEIEKYTVYQGFAGYMGEWGRIGFLYANRHLENAMMGYDAGVFSGFAVIKAGEKIDIIGRYDTTFGDWWEAKFKGSKVSWVPMADNVKPSFIILAVSYKLAKDIWLIPNIKLATYQTPNEGEKPNNDLYANLTLWFKFK